MHDLTPSTMDDLFSFTGKIEHMNLFSQFAVVIFMSASFGARINIVYYIEISYAVYSCFEGSKFEFYFTHVMFTVSTEYATQFRFDVSMMFST